MCPYCQATDETSFAQCVLDPKFMDFTECYKSKNEVCSTVYKAVEGDWNEAKAGFFMNCETLGH